MKQRIRLRLRTVVAATIAALLFSVLLAACGSNRSNGARLMTVGKYGDYRVQMVTSGASVPDSRACADDAKGFAGEARSFVVRYGSTAASSTDVYYLGMREELTDFEVHDCRFAVLGKALNQMLTAKQLQLLARELTRAMADTVHTALEAARS